MKRKFTNVFVRDEIFGSLEEINQIWRIFQLEFLVLFCHKNIINQT